MNEFLNMRPEIFLILGIVSVVLVSGCIEETGQVIGPGECRDVTESYQDCKQVPVDEPCETQPYQTDECEFVELSYTSNHDDMRTSKQCIRTSQECVKYFLAGICEEYETKCKEYKESFTFDLKNTDTVKGIWFFNWMRACKPGFECDLEEPILHSVTSWELETKVTKTFMEDIKYSADSEEYLYIEFVHIPEKEVCSTVTRYRDPCVDKTEEVCETKYRTVQKCD